jgi:hypothetical protein
MSRKRMFAAVALVAAAAGTTYLVVKALEKRRIANETAEHIEAEIDALDPATRAAVLAKVTSHTIKDIRSHAA